MHAEARMLARSRNHQRESLFYILHTLLGTLRPLSTADYYIEIEYYLLMLASVTTPLLCRTHRTTHDY